MVFNAELEVNRVKSWLIDWGKGLNNFVVGISGGIDSAVVAVLCSAVKKTYGVMLPCKSSSESLSNAQLLIEKFDIMPIMVDLSSTHEELKSKLSEAIESPLSVYPDGNLKSRLRAVTLYGIANQFGGVVVGTDNNSENTLGYVTKVGDGLVDCNPLGEYYKSEIYKMAEYLDIPEDIINARPTADLGISTDDESEIGFSYPKIEKAMRHLLFEEVLPAEKFESLKPLFKRVNELHSSTEHKRELPPSCSRK